MKFWMILLVGMIFFSAGAVSVHANAPTKVLVQAEDIFVLKGFDDNDSVELIVSGYLPTLCHQSPTLEHSIEGDVILLGLTALHYDHTNIFCTQIPIPFLEVINIGMVRTGDYKIIVNGGTPFEISDLIHVEVAPTQEQNNSIYAQVDYIEKVLSSRSIVLIGTNPSDCFALDNIVQLSNGKNAVAILPILKKMTADCGFRPTPFRYQVEIPRTLDREKILLHVRRMDGKAINTLFNNNID